MRFDKIIQLILEGVADLPKFKLLDPSNNPRGYMQRQDCKQGYMIRINPTSKQNTIAIIDSLLPDSDIVKKIKREWEKAILISGKALAMHLTPEDMVKYNIKPHYSRMYRINGTLDLDYDPVWEYWLEPTYEKYASKDTVDEFGDLMNEL